MSILEENIKKIIFQKIDFKKCEETLLKNYKDIETNKYDRKRKKKIKNLLEFVTIATQYNSSFEKIQFK